MSYRISFLSILTLSVLPSAFAGTSPKETEPRSSKEARAKQSLEDQKTILLCDFILQAQAVANIENPQDDQFPPAVPRILPVVRKLKELKAATGKDVVKGVVRELLKLRLPKPPSFPIESQYKDIFTARIPGAAVLDRANPKDLRGERIALKDAYSLDRENEPDFHWELHPELNREVPIVEPSSANSAIRIQSIFPRSEEESIYHQLSPTERLRLVHALAKVIHKAKYDRSMVGPGDEREVDEFELFHRIDAYIDPVAALQRANRGGTLGVCRHGVRILLSLLLELGYPFHQIFKLTSAEDNHARLAVKIPELRDLPYTLEATPEEDTTQARGSSDSYLFEIYGPMTESPGTIPAFAYREFLKSIDSSIQP